MKDSPHRARAVSTGRTPNSSSKRQARKGEQVDVRSSPRLKSHRVVSSMDEEREVTPRHLIQTMLAVQGTGQPITRRKKRTSDVMGPPPSTSSRKVARRRSSMANMEIDDVTRKYTPRTNILGFLQQAPEETPVGRKDIPASDSHSNTQNVSSFMLNEVGVSMLEGSSGSRTGLNRSTNVGRFRGKRGNLNIELPQVMVTRQTPSGEQTAESTVTQDDISMEGQRRRSSRGAKVSVAVADPVTPVSSVQEDQVPSSETKENSQTEDLITTAGQRSMNGKDNVASAVSVDGEEVSAVLHGERQSVSLHGEQWSVSLRGEQQSVSLRGEQQNVSLHGEQQSVSLRGEQQNVSLRGEQQNVSLRDEQQNVSLRGERQNVSMRGEQQSVALRGEQQSVSLRGEQQSVSLRGEQQSVSLRGEQQTDTADTSGEEDHVDSSDGIEANTSHPAEEEIEASMDSPQREKGEIQGGQKGRTPLSPRTQTRNSDEAEEASPLSPSSHGMYSFTALSKAGLVTRHFAAPAEAIQPEADTQGEERPNTEMMAGEFTPGGQTELHSMLGMERTEENVTTGRQAERPSVSEERVVDDTAHTQLGPDSFEVDNGMPDDSDTDENSEDEDGLSPLKTPHLPAKLHTPNTAVSKSASSRNIVSGLKAAAAERVPRKRQVAGAGKKRGQGLPTSVVKAMFSHFCHLRVSKEAIEEVEKLSEQYWKNMAEDLEAYATHAHRHTINEADMELLMRRQGLITDTCSLNTLIASYLPLEQRQDLIPIARAGNVLQPNI